MTQTTKFLSRWSRRKRRAADDDGGQASLARVAEAPAGEPPSESGAVAPVFDPASLPSIDSITAETDIRAFLAPGVPRELTQAALRRAWSADPDIRDFVGLADYAWDYHTPGSMPGFGPLEMTDDLRRVVARILGDVSTEKDNTGHVDPRPEAPSEQIAESSIARAGAEIIPQPACDKLSQVVAGNGIILNKVERREDNTSIDPIVRRTHGGALPK